MQTLKEIHVSADLELTILQYCCETSIIQIQQRKTKHCFLVKNSKKKKKKNNFTIEIA